MILFATLSILFPAIYCQSEIIGKLQLCHQHDPQINDCLKSSIQKGLKTFANGFPQYNIPSIEPMEVESWSVPAGKVLPFNQNYYDMKLHNYSTVIIEKVNSTINDRGFHLALTCFGESMAVDGKYEYLNAFLDGVNLTSKGKVKYFYFEHRFSVIFDGEVVKNGGADYLEIKRSSVDILKLDLFKIAFTSEDNDVGDKITTMFNNISNKLINDNREGYERMYSVEFKRIANAILSAFPYDELLPK
ncbi:hypothetical protein RI129_012458 [Pyrocoelia pectoralis]|uniref:Uncharacterized protein n=1 Tax=Pyrocoelia pectoralis TaxID=417401 RepID=A0AAN7V261_9COLE